MRERYPDKEPVIAPAQDRGEATGLIEPLLLGEASRHRHALADLSLELAQRSAGFHRSLPPGILRSLATLVRSMNCYYSNVIEGHHTHPIDIERALNNDYSAEPHKRDLQLEAKAHIVVQKWIDEGGLKGQGVTADAIREIHRRFYEEMPEDLKWVADPATKERLPVIPGELRRRDVQVGQHVAISPGAVPRFLARLESVFGGLGKAETVLATAAAHHRLLWIHPFPDGNGRVMRLLSHATLLDALDTGAVWSVSRGLARNMEAYRRHLAACDMPRRGDLDGRGHLGEQALAAFTEFFLRTCLDQVTDMERVVQPDRLRARIRLWAEEETRLGALPPKSAMILDALLYRGELQRGEIAGILGVGERQGRRILAALAGKNVTVAESSRAPIRLAFPAALASRWLPGLFPEQSA